MIRSGRVCAVVAGPPAETWSNARHQHPAETSLATRAHRSEEHLWGHGNLSSIASKQVTLGNQLLRAALSLLYVCWKYHVPALLSHPAHA
eukprot:3031605-Pyramimonas_sp.AAC.1